MCFVNVPRENQAEDERCLAGVEETIESQMKKGCPVAGQLILPMEEIVPPYSGPVKVTGLALKRDCATLFSAR